jgi:hypothetical protein
MKPLFNAVVVDENNEKKYYTDVGAGWLQNDAKGINIKLINNVSLNRFSLFVDKDQSHTSIAERLNAYVITPAKVEGDKAMWHRVGSAFAHSNGYNVVLNGGIQVVGELVLREPQPKKQ